MLILAKPYLEKRTYFFRSNNCTKNNLFYWWKNILNVLPSILNPYTHHCRGEVGHERDHFEGKDDICDRTMAIYIVLFIYERALCPHTHLLLLHPCLGHTLSPGSCFTQLVGLFLFSVLLLVGGICAVLAHFLRHSCCPPPLQLALTGTYTLTLQQQPIGRSDCHYVIN